MNNEFYLYKYNIYHDNVIILLYIARCRDIIIIILFITSKPFVFQSDCPNNLHKFWHFVNQTKNTGDDASYERR